MALEAHRRMGRPQPQYRQCSPERSHVAAARMGQSRRRCVWRGIHELLAILNYFEGLFYRHMRDLSYLIAMLYILYTVEWRTRQ